MPRTRASPGLQDTYLWVIGADAVVAAAAQLLGQPVLGAVDRLPAHARDCRKAGVAMAVVVQRMVDARTAGVMFTRSPTTGDRSVIVIEGAWGLGSAVVSGEVTPDRFVVGKITGEISGARDQRQAHPARAPAGRRHARGGDTGGAAQRALRDR